MDKHEHDLPVAAEPRQAKWTAEGLHALEQVSSNPIIRSRALFPDLCRITHDYAALKVFKTHLERKDVLGAFQEIDRMNGDARPANFLDFLKSLPEEFLCLLTVFCIETSYAFEEAKKPEEVSRIKQEMKAVEDLFPDIASHQFTPEELRTNQVVHILRDFHGHIASSVLAFLYQSFHERLLHSKLNTQHRLLRRHLSYLFF